MRKGSSQFSVLRCQFSVLNSQFSVVGFAPLGLLVVSCGLMVFGGCSNIQESKITPAFYYWKVLEAPSTFEEAYLDSFGVNKLYLKLFDIDWDANSNDPVPKGEVKYRSKYRDVSFEEIPVVFITNRTLANYSDDDLELKRFAMKIHTKIMDVNDPYNWVYTEVQFDCDWTESTREKYFTVLGHLREIFNDIGVKVSATIRLHQVKYFEKTGVPPVDRGMLMFYNMGDLDDIETENSILDLEIGKKYFKNFDRYPLALDLALPIFQWGVVFRDGKLVKLINNLRVVDLAEESRFKKQADNRYRAVKSTYLDGYYLYEGDLIRLENIDQQELEESAVHLSQIIRNRDLTVAFYHLDSLSLNAFPPEKLEAVLEKFKN